jgi:magnesium transporter
MLSLYPPQDAASGGPAPVWIDLMNPTPAEIAQAEAIVGGPLPSRGSLSEIEMSSRLRRRDDVLIMSTPTAMPGAGGGAEAGVTPIGFVLSAERLVTIRYARLPAFDALAQSLASRGAPPVKGVEVFTDLCDEIVDRIADGLEHLAEELSGLSVATFHNDDRPGHAAARANRNMRVQLRQVGRIGDRLSQIRDALLGLTRILAFTDQFGCDGGDAAMKARLASLRQDLASLSDYDEHLSNKVQFVLDAVVGLISIVQNDIFKVLTIFSIAGIPPTLIAGIYGMNFKNMPEYNWSYGYPYCLGLIALSTILPMIWFKVKGWF